MSKSRVAESLCIFGEQNIYSTSRMHGYLTHLVTFISVRPKKNIYRLRNETSTSHKQNWGSQRALQIVAAFAYAYVVII